MSQIAITNATLLLPEQEAKDTTLLIEDSIIAAIGEDVPANAIEYDAQGYTLIPGLIDLHGDALEREMEPRAGVLFPSGFAIKQGDRRFITNGITTAYHAMSFAAGELGIRDPMVAASIFEEVRRMGDELAIDTRAHCRYEVTDAGSAPLIEDLISKGHADMISFMDHTPGQGQFLEDEDYQTYLVRTYKMSDEEAMAIIKEKKIVREKSMDHLAGIAAVAHKHNVPVASHDDDSFEKVKAMTKYGVRIAEFPINLEAARTARELGQFTVFGSPNVLRGKSQSSGIRAMDAVLDKSADCLCSDYVPGAMLPSAFIIAKEVNIPLYEAIKYVSTNPAKAAQLDDRGSLEVGKRADCVLVDASNTYPDVVTAWVAGNKKLDTK